MTPHECPGNTASAPIVPKNGAKSEVGIIRKASFILAWLIFLPIAAALGATLGMVGFTRGYFSASPGDRKARLGDPGTQGDKKSWIH